MTGLTRRETLKSIGAASGLALGGSATGVLTGESDKSGTASLSRPDTQFVGTWTASPQTPYSSGISNQGFENQTLRMMTRTSVGGQGVRIRLANTFGDGSVTFDRVSVGLRAADRSAAVESGTLRQLTFGGDTDVTLTPGGRVLSDAVDLQVPSEQDLVVNLYTAGATGPTTWHALPTKTSYISTGGDYTDTTDADPFTTETTHWFYLDGVEVISPDTVGTIACLGNSITDGFASTVDANAAYPDFLAERVNDRQSLRKSVLNAGISGNRVLNDSACCGVNALARFDRDVLAQTGVTDVIVLEGINDIGFEKLGPEEPSVTAEQIIDGYQQLIRRAHAKGVRIIGGTLTPFKGAGYYYPEGEQKRQQVNEFIRTSGEFDGVVDFDKAIRDPDDPKQILPKYDSGDKLHPNDAGYEAMAEAVDLTLFQARG
ncbi:SGNH/GDSL hydrolase family protein [Halosolutus halophilus]|uniref:SGNH/GDSL hydrolase family protein n=1 Tax=Halosolutus halophilus TaxID=1552990 RepID=UPI0022350A72|nr:SGNH/GDSL hydrolase family protein [Halosolutus halophilus]